MRYTIMSVQDGNAYNQTYDDLKIAKKKRDLLVKNGVTKWLLLEEDGDVTREIERGDV